MATKLRVDCLMNSVDRSNSPSLKSSALLDQMLRVVARRYCLPALAGPLLPVQDASPATALALSIEQARQAIVRGEVPDTGLKLRFIEALASMIREAMREDSGDSGFQAMVLRHRVAAVREYASLSAHADQDRRLIRSIVDAVAHPAKQQRTPPGGQREALAQLHDFAASATWSALGDKAQCLLAMPAVADGDSSLKYDLNRLLVSPALGRLRRLEVLASDRHVLRYQSLWDRNGPRMGSPGAIAQGSISKQRGVAVEASAIHALDVLARRLNAEEGGVTAYRVVSSMRVPASIPATRDRAKSEWDAVLLRRAKMAGEKSEWDVCLLVEAKASVDAATSDLPRLLRGLRLLAHAEEDAVYTFKTRQGAVHLRGSSLRKLPTDEASLATAVLYCCDAPAEMTSRLLSAASRMQLLTAPASMEFACALAQNEHVSTQGLQIVWLELLESTRWGAVLNQYPMLRRVRELMVHPEDLVVTAKLS